MASAGQWIEGARLRTLPVSAAPVLVGTGAAAVLGATGSGATGAIVWWKAVLALLVALSLQVGVNYANDYSDGVRGTDRDRVGPLRLVGSGVASPRAVRTAAFAAFGVAAVLGLVLALTSAWWLVLVGAAAIAGAWFYTGGSSPYGYRALGEIGVFCFFGLAAVLGTTYVQAGTVGRDAVLGAVAAGFHACALLVANNLRDIPTDTEVGKRTLAVVIGDRASRVMYVALVVVAYVLLVVMSTPWALLGLIGLPVSVLALRIVASGAVGRALVPVLKQTGIAELLFAVGMAVGLVIAG